MKYTMLTYVAEALPVMRQMVAQADVLTKPLVDAYTPGCRIVRIVASGSSYNAAICARTYLRRILNVEVLVTEPFTFCHHEHEMQDSEFCFVISQSGYSIYALEALQRMRKSGRPAIGLTTDTRSGMNDVGDLLVDYGTGQETVGYVTKGVTGLVLFLMLFADAVASNAGHSVPTEHYLQALSNYSKVCEDTEDFFLTNKQELLSLGTTYICGAAEGFGVAREGALKLAETVQIPAFAYETEEMLHGPNLQLTPLHTLFLIATGAGSARATEIWHATKHVTRRSYLLTNHVGMAGADVFCFPCESDACTPLLLLPFFQILSYRITQKKHLWHKHPLLESFESAISGKTKDYINKEVL